MGAGVKITFRLRPKRDDELIEAISQIEKGELSRLVRKGLRLVIESVRQKEGTKKPQSRVLDWSHLK